MMITINSFIIISIPLYESNKFEKVGHDKEISPSIIS